MSTGKSRAGWFVLTAVFVHGKIKSIFAVLGNWLEPVQEHNVTA